MLEQAGYETHRAKDGIEALQRAKELRPDLIVMNQLMPRLCGLEALELMRCDPIIGSMKVVMQSGGHGEGLLAHARELGALAWLSKPISSKELLAAVERALG